MTSTITTPATTNSAAKALTAERTAQVVNSTAQLMRQLRDSSHSDVGSVCSWHDSIDTSSEVGNVALEGHIASASCSSDNSRLITLVVAQLPKELSSKVPNIKNTGKLLYQMPAVVLALDSHMDNALNSASHLGKLKQLLMTDEESKPQQDS